MKDSSSRLFDEFSDVTAKQWLEKIENDLKGKSVDMLHFKPEFDLEAKAYYHPEELVDEDYQNQINNSKSSNDWFITEVFLDDNSKNTNKTILDNLNKGAGGVKIILTANTKFETLFKGVLLEHIFIHIVFDDSTQLDELNEFLGESILNNICLELPALTKGLLSGDFLISTDSFRDYIQSIKKNNSKSLTLSASDYGNYGASSVQELGIAMALMQEVLELGSEKKLNLNELVSAFAINLSVNNDYFVNIAKFRAIKELCNHLFEQWDLKSEPIWINAITGVRNITNNDRYNNLLRQTSSAMSAVIGGSNTLVVEPYSKYTKSEYELSSRMSRNIQLILKDEAYIDKVVDPGAGAYYIEKLTDQMIEKAWQFFMLIEQNGGYQASVKKGFIQKMIFENKSKMIAGLNSYSTTLLGVNKYQNGMEKWIEPTISQKNNNVKFEPFTLFRLENYFENKAV